MCPSYLSIGGKIQLLGRLRLGLMKTAEVALQVQRSCLRFKDLLVSFHIRLLRGLLLRLDIVQRLLRQQALASRRACRLLPATS